MRNGRPPALIVAALLIVGATGGIWCYWHWANDLPEADYSVPDLPRPNGFAELALAAQSVRVPDSFGIVGPTGRITLDLPLDALAYLLELNGEAIDRGLRALRLPYYEAPSPEPRGRGEEFYGAYRNLGRCFCALVRLAVATGDYDAAMYFALETMLLGARIPRGGNAMAVLTGLNCHTDGYIELERIAPHLRPSSLRLLLDRVRVIRAIWPSEAELLAQEAAIERATLLDVCRRIRDGGLRQLFWNSGGRRAATPLWERLLTGFSRKRAILANVERYYAQLKQQADRPWIARQFPRVPDIPIARLAIASYFGRGMAWCLKEAQFAVLEIWLRARLYQLRHGRPPASLAVLAAEGGPLPDDPFTGRPCGYLATSREFLVYSVGPDGRDDGGTPISAIRLRSTSRGDLVFGRMYPPPGPPPARVIPFDPAPAQPPTAAPPQVIPGGPLTPAR